MKARAVWNDAFLVCHEIYQAARELVNSRVPTTQLTSASKFLWRPDLRPRLVEYVADFARCGDRALGDCRTPKARGDHAAFGAKKVPRASRLILFRLYYLGGAEYEPARLLLGLSERTWSDWAEEVRQRVGSELIRAGMYPPARYFREAAIRDTAPVQAAVDAVSAASTNDAPEAKIQRVPCEQNFD
jgi:hypothetical protein